MVGKFISECTVRLLDPECKESMEIQAVDVVNVLYLNSVTESTKSATNIGDERELYSAPRFAFMFYLLSWVLRDNGARVSRSEAVMEKALKVIATHAKVRCDAGDQVMGSPVNTNSKNVQIMYLIIF
ncbi:hypothetical protein DPMN_073555 [Dreissena polymorpha]|uniref:Uncharacterized protein n=1 Tax=Dreissena polymorpha TaxID=45954 RepID=A0A9D4BZD1_DREPO|nr:hypothetical protein DPMN_073555 [Dreissena polymorpha]